MAVTSGVAKKAKGHDLVPSKVKDLLDGLARHQSFANTALTDHQEKIDRLRIIVENLKKRQRDKERTYSRIADECTISGFATAKLNAIYRVKTAIKVFDACTYWSEADDFFLYCEKSAEGKATWCLCPKENLNEVMRGNSLGFALKKPGAKASEWKEFSAETQKWSDRQVQISWRYTTDDPPAPKRKKLTAKPAAFAAAAPAASVQAPVADSPSWGGAAAVPFKAPVADSSSWGGSGDAVDKEELVKQVKDIQRRGWQEKKNWEDFCDKRIQNGYKDPRRHEVSDLQTFIAENNQAPETTTDRESGSWNDGGSWKDKSSWQQDEKTEAGGWKDAKAEAGGWNDSGNDGWQDKSSGSWKQEDASGADAWNADGGGAGAFEDKFKQVAAQFAAFTAQMQGKGGGGASGSWGQEEDEVAGAGEAVVRYLPMAVRYFPILINTEGTTWLIDNSQLQSASEGIAYRIDKDDSRDENLAADYGSHIQGVDEGDGWLKVLVRPDGTTEAPSLPKAPSSDFATAGGPAVDASAQVERYLPMVVKGFPILVHKGGNNWHVDNSQLKSQAEGIAYRKSKESSDVDPDNACDYGSDVQGEDTGVGWLKVWITPNDPQEEEEDDAEEEEDAPMGDAWAAQDAPEEAAAEAAAAAPAPAVEAEAAEPAAAEAPADEATVPVEESAAPEA